MPQRNWVSGTVMIPAYSLFCLRSLESVCGNVKIRAAAAILRTSAFLVGLESKPVRKIIARERSEPQGRHGGKKKGIKSSK
ncbi:hypothetical protein SDJN02_19443, partial [Cucurbita argyrosperma subsp. argyrosperma]